MPYHRLTTTVLVMTGALIAGLTFVVTAPATAAPVTCKFDPERTCPSFEADRPDHITAPSAHGTNSFCP